MSALHRAWLFDQAAARQAHHIHQGSTSMKTSVITTAILAAAAEVATTSPFIN